MISLFCGYDWREEKGYRVFEHSVQARTTNPVQLFKLDSMGLEHGTNAFTMSRFLVADVMQHKGWAIYMDACDMLCLDDITNLMDCADDRFAVQVVKHDYKSRHRQKYIGSDMQCPNRHYERKNWASVMLINSAHWGWRPVTRDSIEKAKMVDLLQFRWLPDELIGEIPNSWNRLVDEGQSLEGAQVLHWTAGAPFVSPYYHSTPGADLWRAERQAMEGSS